MLQSWVETGENKAACESDIIITKQNQQKTKGVRKLLSVRQMFVENLSFAMRICSTVVWTFFGITPTHHRLHFLVAE